MGVWWVSQLQISLLVGGQTTYISDNKTENEATTGSSFVLSAYCTAVSAAVGCGFLNFRSRWRDGVWCRGCSVATPFVCSLGSCQGDASAPGSGYYGALREHCVPCPEGAVCTAEPYQEPVAVAGFWKTYEPSAINGLINPLCTNADRRKHGASCPVVVACEPPESCLGNNTVRYQDKQAAAQWLWRVLVSSCVCLRVRVWWSFGHGCYRSPTALCSVFFPNESRPL